MPATVVWRLLSTRSLPTMEIRQHAEETIKACMFVAKPFADSLTLLIPSEPVFSSGSDFTACLFRDRSPFCPSAVFFGSPVWSVLSPSTMNTVVAQNLADATRLLPDLFRLCGCRDPDVTQPHRCKLVFDRLWLASKVPVYWSQPHGACHSERCAPPKLRPNRRC